MGPAINPQGANGALRNMSPSAPRRGLPSGPRMGSMSTPVPVQRDAPEQSSPVPEPPEISPVSQQEALASLVRDFNELVYALPRENHDLLLTITELLQKTASHSKTTKMPLSNLLLVFCPSLGMNPGVLKVLVENCEAIFA